MIDFEFLHARTTRLVAPERRPTVRQWHHHCPRGRAPSDTTIRAAARTDDSESTI
jgi:hypothetical protein